MADAGTKEVGSKQELLLTSETIDVYLQDKLNEGLASSTVAKYKDAFTHLLRWLADDPLVDAPRLLEWRRYLENAGYSKITVQSYIKRINGFLRYYKCDALCIPKPLRNDLAGRTFGYLTAIEPTDERNHRYVVWRCACKCGKEVNVTSYSLLSGNTTSCGCLNMEILQNRNRYEEGTELRQALEERILNPNSVSGYVGVQPKRDKWTAYITYKKKTYNLGTYSNIEDAIKARARAKEAVMEDAARIYEETDHLYGESPRRPQPPVKEPLVAYEPVVIRAKRSNNTSGYTGVTKRYGKWNASISVNKYRYKLGAYDNLEDAIAARKRAEELVKAGDIETLKRICTNALPPPKEDDNG